MKILKDSILIYKTTNFIFILNSSVIKEYNVLVLKYKEIKCATFWVVGSVYTKLRMKVGIVIISVNNNRYIER